MKNRNRVGVGDFIPLQFPFRSSVFPFFFYVESHSYNLYPTKTLQVLTSKSSFRQFLSNPNLWICTSYTTGSRVTLGSYTLPNTRSNSFLGRCLNLSFPGTFLLHHAVYGSTLIISWSSFLPDHHKIKRLFRSEVIYTIKPQVTTRNSLHKIDSQTLSTGKRLPPSYVPSTPSIQNLFEVQVPYPTLPCLSLLQQVCSGPSGHTSPKTLRTHTRRRLPSLYLSTSYPLPTTKRPFPIGHPDQGLF